MIGIPARQNLHCTFKHSVFGSKMQQLEDRKTMAEKSGCTQIIIIALGICLGLTLFGLCG